MVLKFGIMVKKGTTKEVFKCRKDLSIKGFRCLGKSCFMRKIRKEFIDLGYNV